MTGALRDTMPARIEAARRRLADLQVQRAKAEARHERARAALDELTSPPPRQASLALRRFAFGALFSALIPFLYWLFKRAP